MSTFYEVIATQPGTTPICSSADTLKEAKELRDQHFATGRKLVFIRQYVRGGERYRVLHSLTLRRF